MLQLVNTWLDNRAGTYQCIFLGFFFCLFVLLEGTYDATLLCYAISLYSIPRYSRIAAYDYQHYKLFVFSLSINVFFIPVFLHPGKALSFTLPHDRIVGVHLCPTY